MSGRAWAVAKPKLTHKRTRKSCVITVSGPHGTGKSTYARAIAEALHLRYLSAGELFRQLAKQQKQSLQALSTEAAQDPSIDRMLDERTKAEAKKGGVVIDAQLAPWMAGNLAHVKVLLTAPNEIRFKRIAERDHVGIDDARRETEYREAVQQERYKKYYGIDVNDLSVYDIKIDTSLHPIEDTKKVVIQSVQDFLSKRCKSRDRS